MVYPNAFELGIRGRAMVVSGRARLPGGTVDVAGQ